MKNNLLALAGGIAGGIAGFFLVGWASKQGFYMVALPGCLVGFGAGMVYNRSILVAVVCGLIATALGLFTEFYHFPWAKDQSLSFFLAHLPDQSTLTLIMIAVGGFVGFWVPYRNRAPAYAEP